MKSRKYRVGTRKWKKSPHKNKEWYVINKGSYGVNTEWQRHGKQEVRQMWMVYFHEDTWQCGFEVPTEKEAVEYCEENEGYRYVYIG